MRIIMPTLKSDLGNGRYSRYVACSIGVWLRFRLYEIEYALGVGLKWSRSDLGRYLLTFELMLDVKTGRSQSRHLPFGTGSAFLLRLTESDAIEFTMPTGPSVLEFSSCLEFPALFDLSLESVCNFLGESFFQESSSGSLDFVRTVFAELSFHESSLGSCRSAATGFCVLV